MAADSAMRDESLPVSYESVKLSCAESLIVSNPTDLVVLGASEVDEIKLPRKSWIRISNPMKIPGETSRTQVA